MELNIPIKELPQWLEENRKKKIKRLEKIIETFRRRISVTYELVQSSRASLELLRSDEGVYTPHATSLINMALMYFYTQYEGFNRHFFRKLEKYNEKIDRTEFDEKFSKFNDIIQRIIKDKYKIVLPFHIFQEIDKCRLARNVIVHQGLEAPPNFEIIDRFYRAFIKFFTHVKEKVLPEVLK